MQEEKNENMEKVMTQELLDSIPEIESEKGIDFEEFVGVKKKISAIKQIEVKTNFDENGEWVENLNRKVKVLRIETEAITTIIDKEGNPKQVCASELFNMKRNEEGVWGISKSDKSKIKKFMTRQKVTKLKDLLGTSVIIKDYTDKKGNTYLGFVIE